MSPERWQKIQDLMLAALERTPATREAFLSEVCAGDSELLDEIHSLLDAHTQADDFFDASPFSAPAPATSDEIIHRSVEEHTANLDRANSENADLHRQIKDFLDVYGHVDKRIPEYDRLSDPDPYLHQSVSHYQILEKLGGGGMGVVYKALDTRLNRIVALKFLPPHLSADQDAKARFLHEARSASGLDHVNICTIFEVAETPRGQLLIAMACYTGETLKMKLEKGALPVEQALDFALQVAQGLAEAHRHGIIHRDIKPANIMVIPDTTGTNSAGLVKLLDFGLAKATDLSLTRTKAVMGTLAYMSPEQARGDAIDHHTDIWSLGVVFYEMLTGQRPFDGTHEQAVVYALLNKVPEPVRTLRKEIPSFLERIVNKTLAKNPADRYDTIQQLIQDLQQVRANPSGTLAEHATVVIETESASDTGYLLPEGERIQTTIVVSTSGNYIDLVEQLSPEDLHQVMQRIRNQADEIIQSHGGVINRFTGEEIVSLFGLPTPHEDDCLRATRAVRALHNWIQEHGATNATGLTVHLHSGIDTGLVVAKPSGNSDQPFQITGHTTQVASTLASHAGPGEILVSPESQRLLAPFFDTEGYVPLPVKGRNAPIIPYRIVRESGLKSRLEAAARAGLTPYTGRERELKILERCLEGALSGEGQCVTVIGEAGLGKSRLLYEFHHRLVRDEITVLQGRCPSHGSGTLYLPFIEILRQNLSGGDLIDTSAEEVVAGIRAIGPELEKYIPLYLHLLFLQSDAYPLPEQLDGDSLRIAILEALLALLTLSTRNGPRVLLLEDWHWSDEASRDVLAQLIELIPAHPLLVVLTYRPEFTPDWGHPAHQTSIRLKPLETAASLEILKSVFHADEFPEEVGTLLHERTNGNPFFLEEIGQTLREEGTLRIEEGRVILTRPMERQELPNTIQAVIRMRLHRLPREVRSVLRLASVIGREFTRDLLQHIHDEETELNTALESLRNAGLIQQTRVLPEVSYRFKHVLTQEVAYESLLLHQRKMMHSRVGEAIETLYPDEVEENAERLAHHFGEAGSWRKAIRYGREAVRKAEMVGQYTEALTLTEQVQQWIVHLPEDPGSKKLLVENLLKQERLCETLGDRKRQQKLIDDLLLHIDPARDPVLVAEVFIRQGDLLVLRSRYDDAEDYLSRALQISEEQENDDLRHRALRSIGFLRYQQGNGRDAFTIIESLITSSRQRNDINALVTDLTSLSTLLRARGEYERALENVKEALQFLDRVPARQKGLIYHIAGDVYRSLGDYELSLYYHQKVFDSKQLYGKRVFTLVGIANIYFEQGKIEESLRVYQESVAWGRKSRSAEELAQSLRILGGVLVTLHRYEEAMPYFQEGAAIFATLEDRETEAFVRKQLATLQEQFGNDIEAAVNWERVRNLHALGVFGQLDANEGLARIARRKGDSTQALRYYREALTLAVQSVDTARESELHNNIGILEWEQGAYEAALTHYEEALRICRERDDHVHTGLMLNSIGVTLSKLHRHQEAIQRLEEAIQVHHLTGERLLEAHALAALGDIYYEQRQFEEALTSYGASLQLRWDLDDRRGEGWMLQRLARVYSARGDMERARQSTDQATRIAGEIDDEELLKVCRNQSD